MAKPLRVLLVENSANDAELLMHELTTAGFDLTCERVETADAMKQALGRGVWDIVLSDYSLPTFSAPDALRIKQSMELDIPFIIVSGTTGEDAAVSALKAGAHDFLVKGRLARLVPAVERELRDAEQRRERKLLEAQQNHAQKMEAIGQLAGSVTHDLNNVLTALLGFCELALGGMSPHAPERRDLVEIRKAGERAADLTRELLAFSRQQVLQPKVHDLNILNAGAHAVVNGSGGSEVVLLAEDDPAVRLLARLSLRRSGYTVLEAGSAADALAVAEKHSGTIDLLLSDVIMPDSSSGAPLIECLRKNRPDLRVLYMSGYTDDAIVHHGVLDEGTAFLQKPFTPHALTQKVRERTEREDTMTHRVLIVDDDDQIRELLRRFLEPEGYEVTQAASAEEAVQRLESITPSVVFCDVHMTGANGLWLAEQIRRLSPSTAMVLATGDSRVPPTESMRSGVVSYLLKPLRRQRVVTAVADGVRWSDEAIARGVRRRPQQQLGPAPR